MSSGNARASSSGSRQPNSALIHSSMAVARLLGSALASWDAMSFEEEEECNADAASEEECNADAVSEEEFSCGEDCSDCAVPEDDGV